MPISSLIIGVDTGKEQITCALLKDIPYVEVGQMGLGKIIITLDTPDLISDNIAQECIKNAPGVKSVSTVFYNMEDVI